MQKNKNICRSECSGAHSLFSADEESPPSFFFMGGGVLWVRLQRFTVLPVKVLNKENVLRKSKKTKNPQTEL